MITTSYNPSNLEIELGEIIQELRPQIEERLKDNVIEELTLTKEKDNPDLILKLVDVDGDKHEVVIKLIQRADQNL